MIALARAAAALWWDGPVDLQFVAGRENQVFRVRHASGDFALRIKRPGYRQRAELASELSWMAAVADAGLRVPRPVSSKQNRHLEHVQGHWVDVLTWMPGDSLGERLSNCSEPQALSWFERLGEHMAQLHLASDAWGKPADFSRVAWDVQGLLGDTPLWGVFWAHPHLSATDQDLFKRFRAVAAGHLSAIHDRLDYGLIHADLVKENVLIDPEGRMGLLDFDDGGWGYRVFDLATALLKFTDSPHFARRQAALLRGYQSARAIDLTALPLFMALRAMTYVGWVVPRLDEPGALERSERFIRVARRLCVAELEHELGAGA
jgi:Ser/Thr protein kinase RdoA (MazF antagonist)